MKCWQELWQRPLVRAAILGIGVFVIYLVENNFFTVEELPSDFSESVPSPKVTTVQSVVFPEGDKASLRDPFTGAKEKNPPKKEENAGLLSKNKMLNVGTEKKPSNPIKTTPVLTGVLQGPQCSQVLLQLGEEQAVIQVGGWIGEYEVKSIESDRVLLNGPAGEFFLALQQMNRQQEK